MYISHKFQKYSHGLTERVTNLEGEVQTPANVKSMLLTKQGKQSV